MIGKFNKKGGLKYLVKSDKVTLELSTEEITGVIEVPGIVRPGGKAH